MREKYDKIVVMREEGRGWTNCFSWLGCIGFPNSNVGIIATR